MQKNASNDKLRANFNKDSDQFQRNMKCAQMTNKEQVSKPHDEKPNKAEFSARLHKIFRLYKFSDLT